MYHKPFLDRSGFDRTSGFSETDPCGSEHMIVSNFTDIVNYRI